MEFETDNYVVMPPNKTVEGYFIPKTRYDKWNKEISRLKELKSENKALRTSIKILIHNSKKLLEENEKLKKED